MNVKLEREYSPEVKTTSQLLFERFGGNPYYAQAKIVAGEVTYSPIKKPLTLEIVQAHLDGKLTLGVYQLSQKSEVSWMGWDIDSVDRPTAKKYAEKIIDRLGNIPHVVEFSGSKGYHVLVFLSKPMPAERAKAIGDYVRDSEGLPKSGASHVEVYPKQSALTKTLPMGSLLKMPLGLHPRTHNPSRFVDYKNGWEAGESIEPNELLQRLIQPEELESLMKASIDVRKQLQEILVPHWVSQAGAHHDFAMYLAGYFCNLGWGLEDTCELVGKVATEAGDAEVSNRVQAVRDTFKNTQAGRTVKGFSGLNELLPGATMTQLTELATKIITPTLVKRVDAIRLNKGAAFEKTRSSAAIIWSDLIEHGEVVQTAIHETFWYDATEHLRFSRQS